MVAWCVTVHTDPIMTLNVATPSHARRRDTLAAIGNGLTFVIGPGTLTASRPPITRVLLALSAVAGMRGTGAEMT